MKTIIAKTAIATAAVVAISVPAQAKDWIESVQVSRDGIDLKPITVRAGGNGYAAIDTNKHRFSLRLYARAKSGKRIVGAKLGSGNGVGYWEADGGNWAKTYNWRAVGSGSKRTWQMTDSVVAPVSKLTFVGKDPIAACNALMAKKRSQGMSRTEVWGQDWTTSAKVMFQLDAVAARKGKAKKNQVSLQNTTSQRKSSTYDVSVKCKARPKRAAS